MKTVNKCTTKIGEIYQYGYGYAIIVSVNSLDVAPNCNVLMSDNSYSRIIGIMERELGNKLGHVSEFLSKDQI